MAKDAHEVGRRAAQTNITRYGEDYYSKIGSKGAKNGDNRPMRDIPGYASKIAKIGWEKRRARKAAEPVDK